LYAVNLPLLYSTDNLIHPTVFDGVPLYPPSLVPAPLLSAQDFYKSFFNDQLVITQPHWFHFFTLVEIFYQLPVVLWGVWALATKSPKAPAHLLIWALVCAGTTATCIFEFYHNQLMTETEKTRLIAMYGLYELICEFQLFLLTQP
jgi:hypothetical protein